MDQMPKNLLVNYSNTAKSAGEECSNHKQGEHLLLSTEQFSVPSTNQKCIQKLEELANSFDLKQHIVIFIRSQLDYINSRYIYSLRRFYHSQAFEEFVFDALEC